MKKTLRNVTRRNPCPICGKSDWCSVSVDGHWAMCRRTLHLDSALNHTDINGADFAWHPLTDEATGQNRPEVVEHTPAHQRADDDVLHAVYSFLLSRLTIDREHLEDLHKRGFDDKAIQQNEYRSLDRMRLDAVKQCQQRFGDDVLLGVPGFVPGKKGGVWLTGISGLLIPCRDADGHINALKVRSFDAQMPKYTYLSSKKADGPGPPMRVHIPKSTKWTNEVRITEGELKADACVHLDGSIPTVSIPGVNTWQIATPVLKQNRVRTVRLAFDADWRTNGLVKRALKNAAGAWDSNGIAVQVELWDLNAAKGIDDLLLVGGKTKSEKWAGFTVMAHAALDFEVSHVQVHYGNPPKVSLTIDDKMLKLGFGALLSLRRFEVAFAEVMLRWPTLPRGRTALDDWRTIVNQWLSSAEVIDPGEDGSDETLLRDIVEQAIERFALVDDPHQLSPEKAYLNEAGEACLQLVHLERVVSERRKVSANDLTAALRELGWSSSRMRIGDKQIRVWKRSVVTPGDTPF